MILCMAGGAMCSLNVMGCYPLVPAYFAALYLEQVSTPMLLGMMYIGIFLFMPLTAGVKYAMVLLVVWGAIRLIEWANGGCPAFMAAFLSAAATVIISFAGGLLEWKNQPEMAAVILDRLIEWANGGCPAFMAAFLSAAATVIISFAGGLLEWKNQPEMAAVILEGVFICGAVILLGRAMHLVLNWRFEPRETEKKERGNEERLRGYAESFQGLSQVFYTMSNRKEAYDAGELGQIQNELTKKERGNEERLRGYAESFQGLSQVFYTMSNRKEAYDAGELGQIQNELTGKICANCDSCALCWERDSAPLYTVLSGMITNIWNGGIREDEAAEQLKPYCVKSRDMVEEAVRVFERVHLNRAWYNRLLENRQVIAEQLDAMAYIMQDCAKEEQGYGRGGGAGV